MSLTFLSPGVEEGLVFSGLGVLSARSLNRRYSEKEGSISFL